MNSQHASCNNVKLKYCTTSIDTDTGLRAGLRGLIQALYDFMREPEDKVIVYELESHNVEEENIRHLDVL